MVRVSNGRSNSASPRLARRRDGRRQEILRAAARSFRQRGFADTGMREIAEAADLSPANLYHYFRGKDEILFYCQDRALDKMIAAVATSRRRPVAEGLQEILAAHVRTLLDEVDGASAHLETTALAPALRARLVKKRDKYERAVRALIQNGVRRGEFEADDPAVVTRAMLGALNWAARWFDPNGAQTATDVAETMARFLVRGVAKASGPRGRRPLSRRPTSRPRG